MEVVTKIALFFGVCVTNLVPGAFPSKNGRNGNLRENPLGTRLAFIHCVYYGQRREVRGKQLVFPCDSKHENVIS